MEKANKKYKTWDNTPFTREMYHAHMEQNSKIAATEEMVMNKL